MAEVLLDSDKCVLSYSTFINSLEPDVFHITSQILLILIDFTWTSVTFFRSFSNLLTLITPELEKLLRNVNGHLFDF